MKNKKPFHRRVILVSWKHRVNETSDYDFMGPAIGKNLKITLNGNEDYSLEKLKSIILKEYVNDINNLYFENSTVELGVQDGHIITEYKNSEGIICSFWHYIKDQRKAGHVLNIFLYTTYSLSQQNGSQKIQQNYSLPSISPINDFLIQNERAQPTYPNFNIPITGGKVKSLIDLKESDFSFVETTVFENSSKLENRKRTPIIRSFHVKSLDHFTATGPITLNKSESTINKSSNSNKSLSNIIPETLYENSASTSINSKINNYHMPTPTAMQRDHVPPPVKPPYSQILNTNSTGNTSPNIPHHSKFESHYAAISSVTQIRNLTPLRGTVYSKN